jgi:hypothetical protein
VETLAGTHRPLVQAVRDRFGGPAGNEILTSAVGAILTLLLIAEGITIIWIGGLVTPHMFMGFVLIPPVLLKLGSTGYRFGRYYTHSRPYVDEGPPALPLRLLAPVLVATTIGIFVTGILLLASGHKSDQLLLLHKVFFFVWGPIFAIHFLAYAPRVARSLRHDWSASRAHAVPGAGVRGVLVAASLGAGTALAVALLGTITGWHTGDLGHPG